MLELDGAGFGYTPQDWVFRDVSFSLPPGTVTAVLGPNGRGKTTLVRCAAGLLAVQEGAVRRYDPAGYVPQASGTAFGYPALDMVVMGRAATSASSPHPAAGTGPPRSAPWTGWGSPNWPAGCSRR